MVKRSPHRGSRIFYARRPECETAEEKLAFLRGARIGDISFEEVRPDAKQNWINLTSNDFDSLMPIATKDAKIAKKPSQEKAIFKLYSMGVITARDEWVYGFTTQSVEAKVDQLIDTYNSELERLAKHGRGPSLAAELDNSIKWTRALKRDFAARVKYRREPRAVVTSLFRPFVRKSLYFGPGLIEMPNQMRAFFRPERDNVAIFFNDRGSRSPFSPIASRDVAEFHLAASSDGFQGVGLYRFDEDGNRIDNITEWALEQFRKHYQPGRVRTDRKITKQSIFHYVYGVLHDPVYREKYAQNLKREFPRIPFYEDFWKWAEWGGSLIELHVGYEAIAPWPLQRSDVADENLAGTGTGAKVILKGDKTAGCVVIDSQTVISGIPSEAWEYRLGNRSALEWVLDQYKEKKPRDSTVRARFDPYRLADHKEVVIDLLARVTAVSVATVRIMTEMRSGQR
jgi:predicted helicase